MCVGKEVCLKSRTMKKVVKPMLPRKVTSTARVNLNLYWKVLEELYAFADHHVEDCRIPVAQEEESLVKDNRLNEALERKRQMLRESSSLNLGPPHKKQHQAQEEEKDPESYCICLLSPPARQLQEEEEEEEPEVGADLSSNGHHQTTSEKVPCAYWNVFGHANPKEQFQPPDALLAVAHKMVQRS